MIKKLKGGNSIYVTDDEKHLVCSNTRNSVYVHDLNTFKTVFQTKTVSNVAYYAISPDGKTLAAKNTSGEIALINMETGEEILRNKMQKSEGYPLTFTRDGKYVLDFDWNGQTMLLGFDNQCKVLDDTLREDMGESVGYLQYDRFENTVYKLVKGGYVSLDTAYISPAGKNIKYKKLCTLIDRFPDRVRGLSICREKIYYITRERDFMVVCDKEFKELERISLPPVVKDRQNYFQRAWVSPEEKYVCFKMAEPYTLIYDLKTMELVKALKYDFVCDFTMIENDTRFILGTWEGAYVGSIEDLKSE